MGAVLHATLQELGRVGYGALRIEDVAALAQVNKTTVYRRWPTKQELVAAALRSPEAASEEPPDTGEVRSDVLAILREMVERTGSPEGIAILRAMTSERDNAELAAVARALREERMRRFAMVIERGVDRGELPAGTDAKLVAESLAAPIFLKLIRWGERADDAYIAGVVDLVLTGARHAGAVAR